jgi:hypothetical protein
MSGENLILEQRRKGWRGEEYADSGPVRYGMLICRKLLIYVYTKKDFPPTG